LAQSTPATTAPAAVGLTESIHQAALKWFDDYLASDETNKLSAAAEAIVDKLIDGGTMYVAGDPGFCDELNYRAGGFAGTKVWIDQKLTDKDVLVIGLLDQTSKASRFLTPAWVGQNRGSIAVALTVHIASHNWPQAKKLTEIVDPKAWRSGLHMLDTRAPEGGRWEEIAVGQLASCAIGNALQAEMISAASRKGKTLATLASVHEPGGTEFDNGIKGKSFLDSPAVKPIERGVLARQYLQTCRRQLAGFGPSGQAENVRRVARRLAECQTRGGTIFTVTDGHVHYRGDMIPRQLSRVLFYGPVWAWEAPQGLAKGDMLLYVGYLDFPKDDVEKATKAGAGAVVLCVAEGMNNEAVTTIRCPWEKYDSVVEVPGYPYKAIASSAVVMTPQWYSLMAEAEALVTAKR
jgi:hypothetical protein